MEHKVLQLKNIYSELAIILHSNFFVKTKIIKIKTTISLKQNIKKLVWIFFNKICLFKKA